MSYEVIATVPFERKIKRLSKKYKFLKSDLTPIIQTLEVDPELGVSIGKNCYKIRFIISSKRKGKSGGGRIITLVKKVQNTVYLMDIFDKSEKDNISDKELLLLINLLEKDQ